MLNVFKTTTPKGAGTRDRIFAAALRLFREHGFDATTMRDVAAAAGQSLGAAYHYFPGKEAIVLAYYARVHDEHARRVAEAIGGGTRLRERLAVVFHAKLDILAGDRPLMGALLRYTGDPSHPLSFLGAGTRDLQLRSMALFRDALAPERLPDDVRTLAPVLLWATQMGLLLYFLYDDSPRQRRTRALTDGAIDLFVRALALGRLPVVAPFRRSIARLLDQAGLLPQMPRTTQMTQMTQMGGRSLHKEDL
jgi:AcrR family transcriptional regulator